MKTTTCRCRPLVGGSGEDFSGLGKDGAPDPRCVVVAKGPRVINIEEGRKFWSFTPIANVTPPVVAHPSAPIKTPTDV